MSDQLENNVREALAASTNMGEMQDADAVGSAGSPGCGDMMRVWVKYGHDSQGRTTIDRATFQGFGCETAMAVASVATEMLKGKTLDEAQALGGAELSAPLGPLPPMKIHCATLVEEALRQALSPAPAKPTSPQPTSATPGGDLMDSMMQGNNAPRKKIVFLNPDPQP